MTVLTVQQGDDETLTFGPLVDGEGALVDPTGATTTLVVKPSRVSEDATGTTYAGTFTGDLTAGYYAQFTIPKADLATLGTKWYRVRLVTAAGVVQTIAADKFIISAQPVSTTTTAGAASSVLPPAALTAHLADTSEAHPLDSITGLTAALSARVAKTGDTMTGALVLPGDPLTPLQAATKRHADSTLIHDRAHRPSPAPFWLSDFARPAAPAFVGTDVAPAYTKIIADPALVVVKGRLYLLFEAQGTNPPGQIWMTSTDDPSVAPSGFVKVSHNDAVHFHHPQAFVDGGLVRIFYQTSTTAGEIWHRSMPLADFPNGTWSTAVRIFNGAAGAVTGWTTAANMAFIVKHKGLWYLIVHTGGEKVLRGMWCGHLPVNTDGWNTDGVMMPNPLMTLIADHTSWLGRIGHGHPFTVGEDLYFLFGANNPGDSSAVWHGLNVLAVNELAPNAFRATWVKQTYVFPEAGPGNWDESVTHCFDIAAFKDKWVLAYDGGPATYVSGYQWQIGLATADIDGQPTGQTGIGDATPARAHNLRSVAIGSTTHSVLGADPDPEGDQDPTRLLVLPSGGRQTTQEAQIGVGSARASALYTRVGGLWGGSLDPAETHRQLALLGFAYSSNPGTSTAAKTLGGRIEFHTKGNNAAGVSLRGFLDHLGRFYFGAANSGVPVTTGPPYYGPDMAGNNAKLSLSWPTAPGALEIQNREDTITDPGSAVGLIGLISFSHRGQNSGHQEASRISGGTDGKGSANTRGGRIALLTKAPDATTKNEGLMIDSGSNVVAGPQSVLATTATDGFLHVRNTAGTPTGVPTAFTGHTPLLVDTTASKLWAYIGGWKSVTFA